MSTATASPARIAPHSIIRRGKCGFVITGETSGRIGFVPNVGKTTWGPAAKVQQMFDNAEYPSSQ